MLPLYFLALGKRKPVTNDKHFTDSSDNECVHELYVCKLMQYLIINNVNDKCCNTGYDYIFCSEIELSREAKRVHDLVEMSVPITSHEKVLVLIAKGWKETVTIIVMIVPRLNQSSI